MIYKAPKSQKESGHIVSHVFLSWTIPSSLLLTWPLTAVSYTDFKSSRSCGVGNPSESCWSIVWHHIKCLLVVYEAHEERLAKFPCFLGDKPQIHYLIFCSTSGFESGLHITRCLILAIITGRRILVACDTKDIVLQLLQTDRSPFFGSGMNTDFVQSTGIIIIIYSFNIKLTGATFNNASTRYIINPKACKRKRLIVCPKAKKNFN